MTVDITSYLTVDRIKDLESADKAGAMEELFALLRTEDAIRDPDGFWQDLLRREETMTTGVGSGIAVPHAKSDAAGGMVMAIGRSKAGVDFAAADDKPVHVVAMIAAGRDETRPYLALLSHLLGRLVEDDRMPQVMEAPDAPTILELLK